jgi:tripartite ATP-independent transporter DctP family solute receptor
MHKTFEMSGDGDFAPTGGSRREVCMTKSGISRRTVAVGMGAAGLSALCAPAIAQAKTTLKLGHLANEENVWHKACLKFAEEVAQRTKGSVEVKVFPNEQLGKETDLIKGIQLGTVDFTITGESLQNWAPAAALLAVPYAIRDLAHMDAVAGGPIGAKIAASIEEKTQLKPLTYFARGPRELTSNRPIKSPADLTGLKMRVPNVPMFVKVWEALGAKPTPMAFSEVFTSLQSNTIEAQENPLALIKSASFFEVQKYLNLTDHVLSWIYLVGGAKKLGRLTAEEQTAIAEAAKAARAYERELFMADEKQLADFLKSKGMEFVAVDKAAFAAKAKDAVVASLPAEIKPLYDEIVAAK